tara:strand:- start:397 stop:624 length:228 start_codon:yes stop_codon:yes gene_type:complete
MSVEISISLRFTKGSLRLNLHIELITISLQESWFVPAKHDTNWIDLGGQTVHTGAFTHAAGTELGGKFSEFKRRL